MERSDYVTREEFEKMIAEFKKIIQDLKIRQAEEISEIIRAAAETVKAGTIEIAKAAAVNATREAVRVAIQEISPMRNDPQVPVIVQNVSNAGSQALARNDSRQIQEREEVLQTPVPADRRIRLKLETFDGSCSWSSYIKQFEIIAKYNGYSEQEKAVVLGCLLRGPARAILVCLNDDELKDFQKVTKELDLRFGEQHFEQFSFVEFHNRKQGKKESLGSFVMDLGRLVRLAYPDCTPEVTDKIACWQFIAGLANRSIRKMLRLENISSLGVAVSRTREIQAVNRIEENQVARDREVCNYSSQNHQIRKSMGSTRRSPELEATHEEVRQEVDNRVCWSCGDRGHIKKNCSHRRKRVSKE